MKRRTFVNAAILAAPAALLAGNMKPSESAENRETDQYSITIDLHELGYEHTILLPPDLHAMAELTNEVIRRAREMFPGAKPTYIKPAIPPKNCGVEACVYSSGEDPEDPKFIVVCGYDISAPGLILKLHAILEA